MAVVAAGNAAKLHGEGAGLAGRLELGGDTANAVKAIAAPFAAVTKAATAP